MFCYFIVSVHFTNKSVVILRKLNDSKRISSSYIIFIIIVINLFCGHISQQGPHIILVLSLFLLVWTLQLPKWHLGFSFILLPFPTTISFTGRLFHIWENKHTYLQIYFRRSRQKFLSPSYQSVSRRNRKVSSYSPISTRVSQLWKERP